MEKSSSSTVVRIKLRPVKDDKGLRDYFQELHGLHGPYRMSHDVGGRGSFATCETRWAEASRSACPGPSGLSVCAPPSFIERYLLQETAMKARLVTNAIQSGHAARDYMRLVYGSPNSSSVDTGSKGQAAHEILRVFEEHNRPSPIEPVIPVRSLVSVLTHDMERIGRLLTR